MTDMTEPLIEINDLLIKRGNRPVLHVDHLSIKPHEVLSIIGPNGSGKSTLLLALSRLIKPDHGEILFQGKSISTIDELAYRRKIGFVLQDPLLMNELVFDNVAMGLRFRGMPSSMVNQQVNFWLDKMGISHLRKRPARSLSGGEAQRVNLARSFVLNPELLLLDEPFSSLDAPTRTRLLDDFHAVISSTKTTTVFVTHDMDEALLLSSKVAVLFNGEIKQVGNPLDVFSAPKDPEIASFVGVETIIYGCVTKCEDGVVVVKYGDILLEGVGDFEIGRNVYYCLRSEDVTILSGRNGTETSARNRLDGKVIRLMPQGPLMKVIVDCGFPVTSLITRASAVQMKLEIGKEVQTSFKATAVHLILT